ncbi:hypothetical protein Zm00014a_022145 [Zea mays]|uniref:Uncharacterized protein n=1 Tax=Zea mays TaxID=4577 RepID=A0A3L6EUZ9_MAIZE|nr:hypothetical protein Zm00014a_022145 [Zea mays]
MKSDEDKVYMKL